MLASLFHEQPSLLRQSAPRVMSEQLMSIDSSAVVVAAAWVVVVGGTASLAHTLVSLSHKQPPVLRQSAPRVIREQLGSLESAAVVVVA
jgi:hypothetical protein